MNANDRFEAIAAEFYRDTGLLAPGKDEPTAIWSAEGEKKRQCMWLRWTGYYAERRDRRPDLTWKQAQEEWEWQKERKGYD